jgi:hypothetical protein
MVAKAAERRSANLPWRLDLIVPASVEAQLELRPAPRGHDQVSKQRIHDRTDRADGHGDGRPGVHSGAEDEPEVNLDVTL